MATFEVQCERILSWIVWDRTLDSSACILDLDNLMSNNCEVIGIMDFLEVSETVKFCFLMLADH